MNRRLLAASRATDASHRSVNTVQHWGEENYRVRLRLACLSAYMAWSAAAIS